MYDVSEKYKEVMSRPARVRRITGTVGTTNFTEANIIRDSLIIRNQCSEGEEVKIGSVYMGSLEVVFTNINFPGAWMDKKIEISEGLLLGYDEVTGDPIWEDVPLGVFRVVEANHAEDGVHVTAYDDMNRLDKTWPMSTTRGTPYDYLSAICTDCHVELKQTEQQIRALPNGTMAFVLYPENDVETYRDMLSWVVQTMGCFATFDKAGKLDVRMYGTEVVDDFGPTDRWRGSIYSDFVTRYTGVSVVKIQDEQTYYKGAEIDDGLTYNLGSNPLLQNMSLENPLTNILTALSNIQYTPFTVYRSGCPALELGDVITFSGGIGAGRTGCLMYYEYTFHSQYRMDGFGSNPALANARSKTDKDITGLMRKNQVENKMQIYTYSNIRQLVIRDAWEEIIHVRFGSLIATRVTFQAEIRLDASLIVDGDTYNDIIGRIKYIFNGEELDYQPTETWLDGDHLLHLLYFFPIEEAKINTLSVRMKCDNGILTIVPQYIHAAVSGQGLASSSDWDGYIEVEDEFGVIETSATAEVWGITGEITVTGEVPTEIDLEDTIGVIETAQTAVHGFDVDVYVNKKPLRFLTWGEAKEYTWAEIEEEYDW